MDTGSRFANALVAMRQGRTLSDLDDALAQAVVHCEATGKPTKITFTVTLKPGGAGRIIVADRVNTALPEPDREDTMFFSGLDGGLSRRDPRQMRLEDLKEVDS